MCMGTNSVPPLQRSMQKACLLFTSNRISLPDPKRYWLHSQGLTDAPWEGYVAFLMYTQQDFETSYSKVIFPLRNRFCNIHVRNLVRMPSVGRHREQGRRSWLPMTF